MARRCRTSLQTQILEMLAARAQGAPALQDAQAVITELDPPESYAREVEGGPGSAPPAPASGASRSLLPIFGFVLLVLGFVLPFLWADGRGFVAGVPMVIAGIGMLIAAYRPQALRAYLIALAGLVVALIGLAGLLYFITGGAERARRDKSRAEVKALQRKSSESAPATLPSPPRAPTE